MGGTNIHHCRGTDRIPSASGFHDYDHAPYQQIGDPFLGGHLDVHHRTNNHPNNDPEEISGAAGEIGEGGQVGEEDVFLRLLKAPPSEDDRRLIEELLAQSSPLGSGSSNSFDNSHVNPARVDQDSHRFAYINRRANHHNTENDGGASDPAQEVHPNPAAYLFSEWEVGVGADFDDFAKLLDDANHPMDSECAQNQNFEERNGDKAVGGVLQQQGGFSSHSDDKTRVNKELRDSTRKLRFKTDRSRRSSSSGVKTDRSRQSSGSRAASSQKKMLTLNVRVDMPKLGIYDVDTRVNVKASDKIMLLKQKLRDIAKTESRLLPLTSLVPDPYFFLHLQVGIDGYTHHIALHNDQLSFKKAGVVCDGSTILAVSPTIPIYMHLT